MDSSILKRLLPHLGAYLIFVVISFIFFKPAVFDGKVLSQSDNIKGRGMAAEITKIQDETGTAPLWTNAAFSGMPAYQIYHPLSGNFVKPVYYALFLWQSITKSHFVILLAMACCYLFLITLKVDWRIAIFGAIAYGISSYHVDLAAAGHSTKLVTFALLPLLYAGPLLAYRGKYLLGGGLFALATTLHIYANHIQITYYAFLLLAVLGIIEFVKAIRTNGIPHFVKASSVLVFAVLLGVSSNTSKLWPTYEYTSETIRGKSELKSKASKGDGLDKEYIWGWSYGVGETMTTLIPNFMGGGASHNYEGIDSYKRMESIFRQQGMSKSQAKASANHQLGILLYMGKPIFVGMGIYFGAIIWFLFVLGAFLVKGETKVWLVASAVISIMIAWGGNFFVNHFLVDYFPMFNKFRAVSMALGLAQLAFVVLAAMGLQKLMDKEISAEAKQKALMYSVGIVGGMCVLALLASFGMDYSGKNDAKVGAELTRILKADRASLLQSDAIRSLVFILLAAGLLFAYVKGKLKGLIAVVAVGLLSIIDIWLVDARYLSADSYETPKSVAAQAEPHAVDKQIQQDPDPHYRVLDLARGGWPTNGMTSYFHKSLGGYHAAKLMRYSDLIERYLSDPSKSMHLFSMLNTKYIIQGEGNDLRASKNPDALGNAWFVNSFEVVADGDAEMNGLATLKPKEKALVQKSFAKPLEGLQLRPDSTATIKLTSYHPDKMVYDYTASSERLAVFSEIYYPPEKGWNMYLDGQLTDPFIKANFALRAARLPAGKHQLEMRFEPRSYYLGENISRVASLLTLLMFIGGIGLYFKENSLPVIESISDVETAGAAPLKKTAAKKSTVLKEKKSKKKK